MNSKRSLPDFSGYISARQAANPATRGLENEVPEVVPYLPLRREVIT